MKPSVLVVGAGFAGACYARILAEAGCRVTVIDKRDHIGGNAFDYINSDGLRVHRYGPHLFHTSNERVVQWLSPFTEWVPYEHRVRAKLESDRYVPLPINIDTINAVFGTMLHEADDVRKYLESISIPIQNPNNAAEYLYSKIGMELTDIFFRRYTKKMWALDLEEMDPSVVKRIPLRYNSEDRYFPDDKFQALPKNGYSGLFGNIFSHENIFVHTNQSYEKAISKDYDFTFNSMPIDDYFGCDAGELPYRSIIFHNESENSRPPIDWATTNFTDEGPFTRETYWHLLPNQPTRNGRKFTRTIEQPCDYRDNNYERYYPVKTADGRYDELYSLYKDRAGAEPNIKFIGRCGTYQYLDMHQVISQSISGAQAWLKARDGQV